MDIERTQFEKEKEPEIDIFRKKISRLAQTEEDPHLADIDVNELTEEDMAMFRRYENGELNIDEIQSQENVSTKLRSYLRAKLEARAWDQR